MKILRLKHTEIDKQRWDKAIENSSFPSIYALSWYLDVVSPNWQALVSEDYSVCVSAYGKTKTKSAVFGCSSFLPTIRIV
jgi:hypothetical protein